MYYGDNGWKENGVNFYCSHGSPAEKVRPGCYVEGNKPVVCTGAIAG